MNAQIKNAWNTMSTPSDVLSLEKFEKVCELVDATPAKIADFIDGGENGWENTDEHNAWLKKDSPDAIASWVSAGMI